MYEHQLSEIKSQLTRRSKELEELEYAFVSNPLVHTPKNLHEIDQRIMELGDAGERQVAFLYCYMTWNMAVERLQDKIGSLSSTGMLKKVQAMIKIMEDIPNE